MYIKSITIDGFKSYGVKTTVTDFDRYFNAITGLNGSGKSNILDSICFLLGIQNMSLVRVNNLRELIYKNGQTGVTKASVTIVFDNTDKQQVPIGYEKENEIIVRKEINMHNQCKYYINGDKKLTKDVQDFFQSVQLNVNNPHFLIMQGRITKVINMKPRDVFGMIEEATNVSLYENKKKEAQNSIEKKNIDLKHIDTLMLENIMPRVEKLKKEQSNLLEYQKLSTELQHLEKVYTAWKYLELNNFCDEGGSSVKELQEQITQIEEEDEQSRENFTNLGEEIKKLEKKKDEESGNVLSNMEEELKEAQLEEAKLSSKVSVKKDNRKEEEKKLKAIQKSAKDEENIQKTKETELQKLKDSYEDMKKTYEENQKKLEHAQKNFEAVSVGLSCENGEVGGTLMEQLKQAEMDFNKNKTENLKMHNEIVFIEKEIKRMESELAKARKGYDKSDETIDQVENRVKMSKTKIDALNFDPDYLTELSASRETSLSNYRNLQESLKHIEIENPSLCFKYRRFRGDFDDAKVFGVVANLFKPKDSMFAAALEKVAGGRLFNVVVDTDETAKLIFNHGQLERRCTLLPLNVIQGRDVDEVALKNAERLVGRDNVFSAISLIEYDPHLSEAMKYVFGDTLVCTNMDIAKKVTFAPNIGKRTVTLDGEVFDPSGTISGGSSAKGGHILAAAERIFSSKEKIATLSSQLREMDAELDKLRNASKKYAEVKAAYDKDVHDLELVRIKYKIETQLKEQIAELETKKNENQKEMLESDKQNSALEKKMKDLKFKIDNSKAARDKELKEAKDLLNQAKKDVGNTKNYEDLDKKVSSLQLEINELSKNIATYEEQAAEVEEIIKKITEEIELEEKEVDKAKEAVKKIIARINEQKDILKKQCTEIFKLQKQRDSLNKKMEENKIKLKKLNHKIEETEGRARDAVSALRNLVKQNPWIEEEKHLFNNKAVGYGFDETFDSKGTFDKVEKMRASIGQLKKTVNLKANILLRDTETEIEELRKKRNTLASDKSKLLEYIAKVDREKRITLEKAYHKINKDFGDIFATLLPGTKAKLDPLEGKQIFDGLNIRIGFGDIWKESLNELSGGQRSLIALSLIFALLLYKPAPIYILDEVDAALDNSHTQNIGIMIKKHFSRSQFIIVSLKDDMFNNANVLFRTKFVNGTSTVARHSKNEP